MSSVVDRVHELVAPVLSDLGLELYDLDWSGGVVRVVVDRPGGVDLEAIASATRLISRELDHTDPVPGHYQLEVTSPGLERNLRTPAHFEGAVGAEVKLRTHPGVEGDRRLEGVVVAAGPDTLTLAIEADGATTEHTIAYADIERARTVFQWGPSEKPGKGSKPGRAPKAGAAARTSTQGKAAS